MATNNGQRVGAFLLATLFLLTTLGATGYVIWQINQGDPAVEEKSEFERAQEALAQSQNQSQDQPAEQPEEDTNVQTIANFSGPVSVPELRSEDEVVGTGAAVKAGDTVTIHYTGALASNGKIFDSSTDGQPATFPLSNLIQGWQQGIPGMKVGGKRRLFIPAALGYGAAGSGSSIPPNADLIFDIELFNTTAAQ